MCDSQDQNHPSRQHWKSLGRIETVSQAALSPYRVVIYDDDTERAVDWKGQLDAMHASEISVRVPTRNDVQAELDTLFNRRTAVDNDEAMSSIPCPLDEVDVLVVDYDLRHLGEHRGFATGEEIAYAARLFSKTKTIVVVNHPDIGLNNFDLTLQRDRTLKADVYVGEKQLANPALWRRDSEYEGFVPWAWPALLDDVRSFETCFDQVRYNLSSSIYSFFGFDGFDIAPSPEIMSFLAVAGADATLRHVIERGNPAPFVRPKDIEKLLRDDDRLSIVVTAVLRKWIRRWVLPPQTMLADAPHLALALPWALKEYSKEECWKALSSRASTAPEAVIAALRPEVSATAYGRLEWTGVPTFTVQSARKALESVGEPSATFDFSSVPRLLFAEDVSRFVPTADAIEYDITLDGEPQVRAVVGNMGPVVYVPQSMLV
jgi:hypothetical protein